MNTPFNFPKAQRNCKALSWVGGVHTAPTHPFSYTTEAPIDLGSDEELMDQIVNSGNWFSLVLKHQI